MSSLLLFVGKTKVFGSLLIPVLVWLQNCGDRYNVNGPVKTITVSLSYITDSYKDLDDFLGLSKVGIFIVTTERK